MSLTACLRAVRVNEINGIATCCESPKPAKIHPLLNDLSPGTDNTALEKNLHIECTDAHRESGMKKSRKGIPALAQQYAWYRYPKRRRFHGNNPAHDGDPEDETLNALSERNIEAMLVVMVTGASGEC